MDTKKIEKIMQQVLNEVDIAISEGNSPFAAFLLDKELNIVYRSHNTAKSQCDPTAHAEINLIRKACSELKTRDLSDYIVISNAWSCSMCMSALIKAKIRNFIYGAKSENDMQPNITIYDIAEKTDKKLNILTGILEEQCQKQIIDARKN